MLSTTANGALLSRHIETNVCPNLKTDFDHGTLAARASAGLV